MSTTNNTSTATPAPDDTRALQVIADLSSNVDIGIVQTINTLANEALNAPAAVPPACDSEIFQAGAVVAVMDAGMLAMEGLVKEASRTAPGMDWHYVAGRAVVKTLGDVPAAQSALLRAMPTLLRHVEAPGVADGVLGEAESQHIETVLRSLDSAEWRAMITEFPSVIKREESVGLLRRIVAHIENGRSAGAKPAPESAETRTNAGFDPGAGLSTSDLIFRSRVADLLHLLPADLAFHPHDRAAGEQALQALRKLLRIEPNAGTSA